MNNDISEKAVSVVSQHLVGEQNLQKLNIRIVEVSHVELHLPHLAIKEIENFLKFPSQNASLLIIYACTFKRLKRI
jgi:hypothetical protein